MALDSLRDFLFGKPPTPEESVKKWRAELRKEMRTLDRSVMRTSFEFATLTSHEAFLHCLEYHLHP